MSQLLKFAIPTTILTAGLWCVFATPSYAKPAYAKAEGKTCTYCHVTAGKAELNEAGKYYAEHDHSLKGYKPSK